MNMRNKLKAQLNNPIITNGQQKLLVTRLKVSGGWSRGSIVLVIFIALILIEHYTGFEQWIRVLTEVEQ